jgi:hypothetical protein
MLQKDPNARPTLTQARAVFSELITSGLVTLKGGTGIAFGSGIARAQTPATGVPRPKQTLAAGTQPAKAAPNMPTLTAPSPRVVEAAPAKKKTGIVVAALAGVLILGGAGAMFAMKGGDKAAPAPAPAPMVATAAPTPPPPPAPVTVETPKAPEKPTPATVDVAINIEGATVLVDNKPVVVDGKTAKANIDLAGDHVVTVNAPGYAPFEQTVSTTPGQALQVTAKLEKTKPESHHSHGSKATATGTKAGSAATPASAPTTTATTPATTGAKGPDVNKDATVDPFK